MELEVKTRDEFNNLLRKHFIPFMVNNDIKNYIKDNQSFMFSRWTYFFTPDISVKLNQVL